MKERGKTFSSDAIIVRFDARRCIHAAECVYHLPQVFDPGRKPWIEPDHADADSIAEVVARCPTGALHFERRDGGAAEVPDRVNNVRVSRNGPLHVRGAIELIDADGGTLLRDTRVALCRCGASRNAPFCDNNHREIRFIDGGEVFEGGVKAGEAANDAGLRISVSEAGPYVLTGPLVVESADGRVRLEGEITSLCRCGHSRNKPFCDGSHGQVSADRTARSIV
ncbi:MAG: hypothetical protein HOP12_06855 [Candidatus Eisenbacteria bacterium]|uniref:Iron-binding zinc finger CDGSH type domain-containing protein n=1 Tax=Eiseniibacteriota bacterium TaxID=2212470 RepID=A0A849SJN2_UNCEI|nr:hypothetical protein [Candidatus Eisenbacteria bacterium]